jgi:secondary thiamine-phosphate synthase enzyme
MNMVVYSSEFELKSKRENDIIDITGEVSRVVTDSGIKNGMVCVFVSGSTGALTTLEYEPGLLKDFPEALERMMPKSITYEHHLRWNDGNGHSHVRASLIGPSLTVPFNSGSLMLGTWQQIVFMELDNRSRSRKILVQVMGE